MKKLTLNLCATIFCATVAARLLGSCMITDSTNIKTSGVYAVFHVHQDANDVVTCSAILRVGGPTGTIVDLTAGEHIECNGEVLPEWVEPITNYHWSRGTVDEDPSGVYDVVFVRTDETVTTTLTMPEPPEILGTDPGDGTIMSNDYLTVYWDDTDPGDTIELSLAGDCIEGLSEYTDADAGEHTFVSPVQDAIGQLPEDCEVILTVTRVIDGSVSSAYQGGYNEARRAVATTLSFYTIY